MFFSLLTYYHSHFRNLQINCPPRNASAFFSVLFLTESPPTPNQTCHLCPSFLPLGFFSPAWNPLPNHLSATSASSASWPQRGVRISWWCTLPTNQRNDNRKTTIKWRFDVSPIEKWGDFPDCHVSSFSRRHYEFWPHGKNDPPKMAPKSHSSKPCCPTRWAPNNGSTYFSRKKMN